MVNKWDSEKYLKFEKERTQPAIDLVRRVEGRNVSSVLDVGCGPGNSSVVIKNIFSSKEKRQAARMEEIQESLSGERNEFSISKEEKKK